MAEGGDAPFRPVPFQITDPERIPAKRYYDEEFFRLENERLWPHVWQMAARLETIPNPGDWIEYKILDKSVLIVRGKDGQVRAFHNACRHRGVRLAAGHGNCEIKGFVCPFHAWRYNTEGKNTFVYARHLFDERQLEEAEINLAPCRMEIWGGCAFINFDDNAPSLRESMGELAERLEARGVDNMRAEWWYATVLPANWKIAMEAFMESYHVLITHPQLQAAGAPIYNAMFGHDTGGLGQPINPKASTHDNVMSHFRHMELVSEGMAGMAHPKDVAVARTLLDVPLPEDPLQGVMMWYGILNDAVTKAGRARGEPTPDLNAIAVSHPVEAVEFVFPHFFLLPVLSSMSSYRIRPLTAETCVFELWSLTLFPEGQEPEPVREPTFLEYNSKDYPEIPQQDYSNIPLQQIGLHAGGFEYMRLGGKGEGMISNYQRIIDGYLKGLPQEKLAEATAKLLRNFDGPVKDMGV